MEFLPKEIEDYCRRHSQDELEIYRELTAETYESCQIPQMLSGPMVGAILQFFVRLTQARRVLEVGMFTGYSALKMAEGLDGSGELLTCEIDPDHITIGRNYFQKVTWGKRITVLEGTALESLANLEPSFDLVFIDADKINYLNYYKRAVELIWSGGIIVLDNALWSGRVIMPEDDGSRTIAETNDFIQKDDRVWNVLLPIRDGLMVVQKK
jgi:caffeoyl-CoA O-methyltransferase